MVEFPPDRQLFCSHFATWSEGNKIITFYGDCIEKLDCLAFVKRSSFLVQSTSKWLMKIDTRLLSKNKPTSRAASSGTFSLTKGSLFRWNFLTLSYSIPKDSFRNLFTFVYRKLLMMSKFTNFNARLQKVKKDVFLFVGLFSTTCFLKSFESLWDNC